MKSSPRVTAPLGRVLYKGVKMTSKENKDRPFDPESPHFVLHLETDKAARYALAAYADYLRYGNKESKLADEINAWLDKICDKLEAKQ